jgi:hypothetical protein
MGTKPRTKALKADQLKGELKGDLSAYEKFGLFQRSVNQNTAYRYRGALLRYQLFLGENPPSLSATCEYLGLLRKNAFDPSTLRVYRAALSGYHQWRGEDCKNWSFNFLPADPMMPSSRRNPASVMSRRISWSLPAPSNLPITSCLSI